MRGLIREMTNVQFFDDSVVFTFLLSLFYLTGETLLTEIHPVSVFLSNKYAYTYVYHIYVYVSIYICSSEIYGTIFILPCSPTVPQDRNRNMLVDLQLVGNFPLFVERPFYS